MPILRAETLSLLFQAFVPCRLRKEAQGTPPGIARDLLIRKARRAETAAHMQDWLKSPGLRPPG